MPPKYVFNHILLFDIETQEYRVYPKLDKKIPKTTECYGQKCIAKGYTVDEAISSAVSLGIKHYDIQKVMSNG